MTPPTGALIHPPKEISSNEAPSYFTIGVLPETQCIYYMKLEKNIEMQFMFTNINLTNYEAIQVKNYFHH